jgi:cytochrome c553
MVRMLVGGMVTVAESRAEKEDFFMQIRIHRCLFLLFPILLSAQVMAQTAKPAATKSARPAANPCVDCHIKETPKIVSDWQASVHSKKEVVCATCHGEEHNSAHDFAKAQLPTPMMATRWPEAGRLAGK